jgi:hypothetical protein
MPAIAPIEDLRAAQKGVQSFFADADHACPDMSGDTVTFLM